MIRGIEQQALRREFNLLASIDTIKSFNGVVPEAVKKSILDDELSYVEEGVDAPQVRSYNLGFDGYDLFDDAGRSIGQMLEAGVNSAESGLTLEKAIADRQELGIIVQMMSGEIAADTLIGFRPFPEEAETDYGTKKLEELGLQPARKLGFMSIYHREKEGYVSVQCISLDNTSLANIRAIAAALNQPLPEHVTTNEFPAHPLRFNGSDPDKLRDEITNHYDQILAKQTGVEHYRGRPITGQESNREIGKFLKLQTDLVEYFWQSMLDLANDSSLSRDLLEKKKKTLTYSFWAALKERYSSNKVPTDMDSYDSQCVGLELIGAGTRAFMRGDILRGCGSATKGILDMDPDEALDAIWNNGVDEEDTPSELRCPECSEKSPKEKVVSSSSWHCPKCHYEVDVCTGAVINKSESRQKESLAHAALASLVSSPEVVSESSA